MAATQTRRTQMNFKDDKDRKELLRELQNLGMVVTFAQRKPKNAPESANIHAAAVLNLPSSAASHNLSPLSRSQSSPQYHTAEEMPSPKNFQVQPVPTSKPQGITSSNSTLHKPSSYADAAEYQQRDIEDISTAYAPETDGRPISASSVDGSFVVPTPTPAPAMTRMPDAHLTLQDVMPARRHLPFAKKPSSKSKLEANPEDNSSHSSKNDMLPPLPTPTFHPEVSSPQPSSAFVHRDMRTSEGEEEMYARTENRPATRFAEQRGKLPRLGMPLPPIFFQRPDDTAPGASDSRSYHEMTVYEDEPASLHDRIDAETLTSNTYAQSSPIHSPARSPRPSTSESWDHFALSSPVHSSSRAPLTSLSHATAPPVRISDSQNHFVSSPIQFVSSPSVQPTPSSPAQSRSPRAPLTSLPPNYQSIPTVPTHSPHNMASELDRLLANHESHSAQQDSRALAAYAGQTREQRADVLNTLVVDYLEDPNFRALCEDLDGAWRWGFLSPSEKRERRSGE